ncbi:MAG: arylsulfatase [Planctomycetota bacterium]
MNFSPALLVSRTLIFLALAVVVGPAIADDPARPNVIVILADDMGLDSVSAFNESMGLETPAIDRLTAGGLSFLDAHSTSAVCTPTRYSVLTGRYNWRSRLKRGIVQKWERPLIEDERLTLPEMFKERGYATACIGKWHLGWNWSSVNGGTTERREDIDFAGAITGGPNDHGFDYYFGDDVPNWPPFAWQENDRLLGQPTATMEAGAMIGVSAGPAMPGWDFNAVLQEYTRRWKLFIQRSAEVDAPFFLYAPMPSPHTPIAPHQSFQGATGAGDYADFLVQTDHAVGEIMKALEESGQLENTLVIFTCDNGTSPKAEFEKLNAAGIRLNENWRGWKADAYEGGHRVPFIVHWPGAVEAGGRSDQTITLADIMATCAEIVDFPVPENAAEDSVSLMPVMRGETIDQPLHETVVHHSISGRFAVRKGDWKLILGERRGHGRTRSATATSQVPAEHRGGAPDTRSNLCR